MRKLCPFFLSSLLCIVGCSTSDNSDISRFHEDGRAKPLLSIASLIDTSSSDLPWSLSDEITGSVVRRLSEKGDIYVTVKEEGAAAENPFSDDLTWVKREFPHEEFVAFLELVQHEVSSDNHLKMAVRIRLIDLRGIDPKISLQEVVRESYYIPKTLWPTNYNEISWGSEAFAKTPMGLAHAELIRDLTGRLSTYVLLAKSR